MIIDHPRDIDELKKLYESRPMPSQYDFNWLVNNPNLFCFYHELKGNLTGFITVQTEEVENFGRVHTLSGISIRKNMPDIIKAIIKVCDSFNCDMYSHTPLKEAGLVLKKAGFERLTEKTYRRLKNDYGERKTSVMLIVFQQ